MSKYTVSLHNGLEPININAKRSIEAAEKWAEWRGLMASCDLKVIAGATVEIIHVDVAVEINRSFNLVDMKVTK